MVSTYLYIKNKITGLEENNRVIFFNAMGSFGVKGLSLAISLLTLPAYLKYFDNQEVLGLWFTLLSVLSWILTFDLGVGNGLRNYLVPLLVKKDYKEAKKYISSAYFTIGIITLLGIIIGITFLPHFDWNKIFKIERNLVSENTLITSILLVFISIMLQFLLRLVSFILYAMQKSFINNLFNLLNTLSILIYVALYKNTNLSTKLVNLSLVNILSTNIPLVIITGVIFRKELRECTPNYKFFRMDYSKKILGLGGQFFFIQIMYMLITTTNEFLIVRLASPENVVEYQIYNRLFSLISILFTLTLTPIWSVVTKAISERNYLWIEKLYNRLIKMTFLGILLEVLLVLVSQNIIDMWLGKNKIIINHRYAFIFSISASMFIWNGVVSSVANGIEKLKTQIICFSVAALLKIPLSIWVVSYLDSWIGIVLVNILIILPYCVLQPMVLGKYIKKMKVEGEKNV